MWPGESHLMNIIDITLQTKGFSNKRIISKATETYTVRTKSIMIKSAVDVD
jgi:hypothetical protein